MSEAGREVEREHDRMVLALDFLEALDSPELTSEYLFPGEEEQMLQIQPQPSSASPGAASGAPGAARQDSRHVGGAPNAVYDTHPTDQWAREEGLAACGINGPIDDHPLMSEAGREAEREHDRRVLALDFLEALDCPEGQRAPPAAASHSNAPRESRGLSRWLAAPTVPWRGRIVQKCGLGCCPQHPGPPSTSGPCLVSFLWCGRYASIGSWVAAVTPRSVAGWRPLRLDR